MSEHRQERGNWLAENCCRRAHGHEHHACHGHGHARDRVHGDDPFRAARHLQDRQKTENSDHGPADSIGWAMTFDAAENISNQIAVGDEQTFERWWFNSLYLKVQPRRPAFL